MCKLCITLQEKMTGIVSSWLLVNICQYQTAMATQNKNGLDALDRPSPKIVEVLQVRGAEKNSIRWEM